MRGELHQAGNGEGQRSNARAGEVARGFGGALLTWELDFFLTRGTSVSGDTKQDSKEIAHPG